MKLNNNHTRTITIVSITILMVILTTIGVNAEVGVTITFPDGSSYAECVDINNGADGYQLMNKLDVNLAWAGPTTFGHQLCKVDGVGDDVGSEYCEYSGKYWGLFTDRDSKESWEYMPVGFDGGNECWNGDASSYDGHYCVQDGDLIGLRYGKYGDEPEYYSYEDICKPLKLKDVQVKIDGHRDRDIDETGGRIKAYPGSEIEFTIDTENNFPLKLEIKDIEAQIEVEDLDLDADAEFSDLDEGDDDDRTIRIKIPDFVDEDNYDLELRLWGETEHGVDLEVIVDYTLKINKERHDLEITELALTNHEVCAGESTSVITELINYGSSDEDISLSLMSNSLKLNFSDSFTLNEGNNKDDVEYYKRIDFTVPRNTPVGNYNILLDVNYKDTLQNTVVLSVLDCGTNSAKVVDKTTQNENVQSTQTTQTTIIPNVRYVQPKSEQTITDNRSFIEKHSTELILGVLVALLIVMLLFVMAILKD